MLFNSAHFAVFLLVVLLGFFSLKEAWRLPLLFLASCYFYMALVPAYILILLALILLDYGVALLMQRKGRSEQGRRLLLVASVVGNLSFLAVFKYFNFFIENIDALARAGGASGSDFASRWRFRSACPSTSFNRWLIRSRSIDGAWPPRRIFCATRFTFFSSPRWSPARSSGPSTCCPVREAQTL